MSEPSLLLVEPLVPDVPLRHASCAWKFIPFVSFLALGSSCLPLRAALFTHVMGQQRLTIQEKATIMGTGEDDGKVEGKVEGSICTGVDLGQYNHTTQVHVGGAAIAKVSHEKLKDLFQKYGAVVSAARPRYLFGYVQFSTASAARAAVKKTNGTQYSDGIVLITELKRDKRFVKNARVQVSDTIYVGGLPSDVDKEKFIEDVFKKYGRIVHVSSMGKRGRNRDKRWAYVKYSTAYEASAAVEKANGTQYGDSVLITQFRKPKTGCHEELGTSLRYSFMSGGCRLSMFRRRESVGEIDIDDGLT